MPSLEDQFWSQINERHALYLKKAAGNPKPWTTDPIMQQYKFTNVFRELDRTTLFMRENIREPLWDEPELLLFNVALFRQTGAAEGWQGLVKRWDPEKQAAKYVAAQERGMKVFTGAYMVTGKFPDAKGNSKVVSLFKHALQPVWENRRRLVALCHAKRSMEALTGALGEFIGWKGNRFMAYEVACDLLYTPILEGAGDQFSWANPGPGAQRGLSRLYGGEINMGRGAGSRDRAICIKEMQALLKLAPKKLGKHILYDPHGEVDMRFIENALCEFDKHQRTLLGQGRPRSKYNGA